MGAIGVAQSQQEWSFQAPRHVGTEADTGVCGAHERVSELRPQRKPKAVASRSNDTPQPALDFYPPPSTATGTSPPERKDGLLSSRKTGEARTTCGPERKGVLRRTGHVQRAPKPTSRGPDAPMWAYWSNEIKESDGSS